MPGKRPVPLPDAIFKPKSDQSDGKKKLPENGAPLSEDMPEEIPVHNTFIQFGAPKGLDLGKQLSTAPAWIGPTLKSMIQSFIPPTKEPDDDDKGEEEADSTGDLMASPMNVPVFRYSLSSTSARAAGVPASSQVVASYERWPEPEKVHAASVGPKAEKGETDKDNEDKEAKKLEFKSELTLETLGDLPSLGSERHDEGLCKRCCFFPKGRCQNGKSCEFCHYPHEKRKRKKKKKKKSAEKDGSDSEVESEVDEEDQVAATIDCGGSSTASPDRRRGGSSASESQVVSPSEKLQTSPVQGDSSTITQLSNLESIESDQREDVKTSTADGEPRFHSGEDAASPKNEGYMSMPSTASSVPNWPKTPFELDDPGASSTAPSKETFTFTPGALSFPSAATSSAPPVPPPPDVAPVSITADQRVPLYPPPAAFADYDYTADCGWGYRAADLAGIPTCPPAAPPTFSTRPPPR